MGAGPVVEDNEGTEIFSNQLETKKPISPKDKDIKDIKKLKGRLEETLNGTLPVLGEDSKKRQCLKIVSKGRKALERISRKPESSTVEFDRRRKSVINMAEYCAEVFINFLRTGKFDQRESQEINLAVGDFFRYAAEAINTLLKEPSSAKAAQEIDQAFDRMAVRAWYHYDLAYPPLDVYDAKMHSLFQDKMLYYLVANLRYLTLTIDHNKLKLGGAYISYVETSCSCLRASLEDQRSADFEFVDSFLSFLSAFCDQSKQVALGHPSSLISLQRTMIKAKVAFNNINEANLNRCFIHSMILALSLVGKLFAMLFRIPPLDASLLLRTGVVSAIARSDFISEAREDLWDDLTKYVIENTEFNPDTGMIKLIRQLNSWPGALAPQVN